MLWNKKSLLSHYFLIPGAQIQGLTPSLWLLSLPFALIQVLKFNFFSPLFSRTIVILNLTPLFPRKRPKCYLRKWDKRESDMSRGNCGTGYKTFLDGAFRISAHDHNGSHLVCNSSPQAAYQHEVEFVLGKKTSAGYLGLNLCDFPCASFCYNYSSPPTLKLLQCVAEQGVRCVNECQVSRVSSESMLDAFGNRHARHRLFF